MLPLSYFILASTFVSLILCFSLVKSGSVWVYYFSLLYKKGLPVEFYFVIDWISLIFIFSLLVIVSCVFIFGSSYLKDDPKMKRFFLTLLSFVVFMCFMIINPHPLFFLLGWDGLGLVSFLLVSYYNCGSSYYSSMKTYLINRLGDGFMIACLALVYTNYCLYIKSMSNLSLSFFFLFFLGCMTKSANFPFSSWLPEAMAAPTPVSALVHSSTLVTAGLYLLMRFYNLLPNFMLYMVTLLGLWTLLTASMAAVLETDSKKMMAYSTMSQLGFISLCLGLVSKETGFSHMISHAYFKALLFMLAGYVLMLNIHFQDCREYSLSVFSKSLLILSLLLSLFSLLGFFFLSGYFTKELLIDHSASKTKMFIFLLILLSLGLTVLYSIRLFSYLLINTSRSSLTSCFSSDSLDYNYLLSMLPLLFFTTLGGFFMIGMLGGLVSTSSAMFKISVNLLIYGSLLLMSSFMKNMSFSKEYFSTLAFTSYWNSGGMLSLFNSKSLTFSKLTDKSIISHQLESGMKKSLRFLTERTFFKNSLSPLLLFSLALFFLFFLVL